MSESSDDEEENEDYVVLPQTELLHKLLAFSRSDVHFPNARENITTSLEWCKENGKCSQALQSLATDLIYLVSQDNPHAVKSALPKLFDTMMESYDEMIYEADVAQRKLERMLQYHKHKDFTRAIKEFEKTQVVCHKVIAIIQHIIDAKFDSSDFKCWEEKCTDDKKRVSPNIVPERLAQLEKLPRIFRRLEWNEHVALNGHLVSHLDYMWTKAKAHEADFHAFMYLKIAKDIGMYFAGPLKSKLRCVTKVQKDYAKNKTKHPRLPSSLYLKDIVRGSLVCPDMFTINTGLKRLQSDMTSIKDRIQLKTHDVLVNVLFQNVHCEIQFHLLDFYHLTAFSHGPYEVQRAKEYTELIDAETNKLVLKPFKL